MSGGEEEQVMRKGMPVEPLQDYIKAMEHATPPHAGAGVGLEVPCLPLLSPPPSRAPVAACSTGGAWRGLTGRGAASGVSVPRPRQRPQGLHVPPRPESLHPLKLSRVDKSFRTTELSQR